MIKPEDCVSSCTSKKKTWLYEEYYIGERDDKDRKHGHGENHWTGAKSIEWYTGHMVRDTMHGWGTYRWRCSGRYGEFVTYEGHFFANQIHGYGVMSYPDGRVFTGLYGNNVRWGPGEERHTSLHANVGFWRGDQLVRLAWRPNTPCLVPDLTMGPQGPAFLDHFRTLLERKLTIIGETNHAIDLLKHEGADPRVANEKWSKLYPDKCTDLQSPMCHVDIWTEDYYGGKIQSLQQQKSPRRDHEIQGEGDEFHETPTHYFSWNDTPQMVEMMKHCYKFEGQRNSVRLNLEDILNGNRKAYLNPDEHERDCRTLLMASYLGHITNVVQLVNKAQVYPDIADVQGNTAIMYATCGHHEKIIHFLVEAGGNVNSINDSCCTPLGVALIWYLCAEREIDPKAMLHSLLPSVSDNIPPQEAMNTSEWLMKRKLKTSIPAIPPQITPFDEKRRSISKAKSAARVKSAKSLAVVNDENSEESFIEETRMYYTINQEYEIRIKNLYGKKIPASQEYIFVVRDMVLDVYNCLQELAAPDFRININQTSNKSDEINKSTMRNKLNSPENVMKANDNVEPFSENVKEKLLDKIMQTVLQLLSDRADPRMVKCPKPALFLAIMSGNTQLIRYLVRYGADFNEIYPESFNYRPVDIAVSLPFTSKHLEVVRTILECGAEVNHRLKIPESIQNPREDVLGPSLLHAVLARKVESEVDEDIRNEVIQTLLQFNCDPTVKFKESTAIEIAMTKQFDLLDLFVTTPALVDLNASINENNQSILVKMFSAPYFLSTNGADRFPIIAKLLMYGTDPLIECHDGNKTYDNIYVYARHTLYEEMGYIKQVPGGNDSPAVVKVNIKPKTKSITNVCYGDYLESLQLLTQCGRMLHVRWIQAKLLKELIYIIGKFRYRNWNMILKEHDSKKRVALWLNPQRCYEIWDILKETRRRVYQDEKVLRYLLCIVLFYNNRFNENKPFEWHMTIEEKRSIDCTAKLLMKEYNLSKMQNKEWKKKYVKPELCSKDDPKFNICFDCALPLKAMGSNIICSHCTMVSFCSRECMKENIERAGCHPCSEFLKQKYFSHKSDDELRFEE